jgi:hypothetical protein
MPSGPSRPALAGALTAVALVELVAVELVGPESLELVPAEPVPDELPHAAIATATKSVAMAAGGVRLIGLRTVAAVGHKFVRVWWDCDRRDPGMP